MRHDHDDDEDKADNDKDGVKQVRDMSALLCIELLHWIIGAHICLYDQQTDGRVHGSYMRIMAVIFWIMAVICSGVGSRDTRVSKNYDMMMIDVKHIRFSPQMKH